MGNCIASQTYNNDDSTPSSRADDSGNLNSIECYSYDELHTATKGYKKELRLGQGFLGEIYEGWIGQNPVAVKVFKSNQALNSEEISSEIKCIWSLHHKYLSKILGYRIDSDNVYLVYEFVSVGSLDNLLFSSNETNILSFKERMTIALSSATALSYLHKNNIIHGNFKASNILLNMNYKVKLTEFGLYRVSDLEHYKKDERRKKYLNFCDPSLLNTEKMTKFCDVYSFGVLLLQLLTGKNDKSVSSKSLCDFALPIFQKKVNVESIFDPSIKAELSSKVGENCFLQIGKLAKRCLNKNVRKRPDVDEIMHTLNAVLNQFQVIDSSSLLVPFKIMRLVDKENI